MGRSVCDVHTQKRLKVGALLVALTVGVSWTPLAPMATARAAQHNLPVYLPNVTKTLGGSSGWTTPFTLQNVGSTPTSATIAFYRFSDGSLQTQFTLSGLAGFPSMLNPGQSWTFDPLAFPSLPGDRQYSAVVTPTNGQLSVVVRQASGSTSMAYAGATSGDATVYLPNITRALGGPNGWQTPFIVQNLDATAVSVSVSFYRFGDGALAHEIAGLRIEAGRSASVLPWTIGALSDGEQYGVVVRGPPAAKLYAVVNQHAGAQAMSYEGLSGGARVLYLPNVVKHLGGPDGWSSPFIVQNMGTASAAFSASFFAFADGTLVKKADGLTLAPGRSLAMDVRFTPVGLPPGQYSVVIEGAADARLGTVVNQTHLAGGMSMAYNALATGTNVAYVPYVQNRVGAQGWVSPIVAQNLAGAAADMTITLFNRMGAAVAQRRYLGVRSGAASVYDPRTDASLPPGMWYSATVHSTAAVAAIVNHTGTRGDAAMSFTSSPGAAIASPTVAPAPSGLRFDFAPDTSDADTPPLRLGISRATDYLREYVGGDRPRSIVVYVVTSGGGIGGGDPGGTGYMYLTARDPALGQPFAPEIESQKTSAHEYVHTWQGDLGCLFPAPKWFKEGMAEFIAYAGLIRDGVLTEAEVLAFHRHIQRAPRQSSLLELETAFPQDAYPYSVGYHAIRLLLMSRDPLTLRTLCEDLGNAVPWEVAFQLSFGTTREAFYAEFAAYRKGL